MKPDDDIFAEALELPAAERPAFLDRACAGQPDARARIEALLSAHDEAQRFLERPLTVRPPAGPEEEPGTVIGPYTLRERIGEGGCGVVWLAQQSTPLRRFVALKVIKPGMDTRSVIARFESERQTLALMTHPDIARIYDAGTTPAGRPYFVMEYVEGIPITRFCDEHSLAMERRLELFARVCLALQHAHQKGVIHRDLKPSNILVSLRDGAPCPKIIDFGIAKATTGGMGGETLHTELGLFMGTPAYMSPEQAELRHDDVDTRSDVYALGVLLYELLTGRPPYDPKELVRAGVFEIRRIIREVDPPRPSTRLSTLTVEDRDTVARQRGAAPPRLTAVLKGDLDWIVMRCLEKERDRRYGTAAALAEDVQRHLRQQPVEARPPHALYRLQKFALRNRLAVAAVTAVTLALVAGTTVSTWQAVRATRAERLAATERDAALAARGAEAAARADAQRRQEQAEALLTFMLGDFRTELQKIGRLELLDRISAQAMEYFESLDLRDVTDTALTRQAKALTQLGEVRLEQARFAEAEQAFTAAHARAAALAARHPQNGDMLYERAQAEFWIGFAARRRGDLARQREWLVKYRDTGVALAALEGATRRSHLELASGHHNLAVLDVDAGNFAPAQAGFVAEMAALAPLLAAAPNDPELLYRRADGASWLGTIAERNGRYPEAADHYTTMAGLYERLAQLEPADARWQFELAQSLTFAGTISAISGERARAAGKYSEAMAVLQKLVALDPANKRWQSVLLRLQLTQAALRLAPPAALLPTVSEVRKKFVTLAAAEPASVNFARLAVMAWTHEAGLLLSEARLAEAHDAIAQARPAAERLWLNPQADIWTRHLACHVLIMEGRIAAARGQPLPADHWRLAAEVLGPADRAQDWRLLEPAALIAVLSGDSAAAAPLVARLKAFGHRSADPYVAATLGLTE
ncbi:serine/threonine-protein kinase [Oleiharenicola lentus]|uniref:serine/threonine-protein kinase n=1 Tax=Oleiharenicola lentus TaxID=2508720 RepID=UPI0013E95514|nr:serine/threonine-protein kinase [Oleiharenicola lentus]